MPEVQRAGRDSTLLTTWTRDIKIVLADFYGKSSPRYSQFDAVDFAASVWWEGRPDSDNEPYFREGLKEAEAFLTSRVQELEEDIADEDHQSPLRSQVPRVQASNARKIFVVHGHDKGTKETVARYLSKLELEPIILHERPNEGKTIIEKFEHHSDVGCAVVILTADDVGASKADPSKLEDRARQNVVFEMGFFYARLGRSKTIALLQKGLAKPSDIDGVLYIPMEDGIWEVQLLRELKAAGLHIDANKAFT